jgi:hypothetical protein
MPPLHRTQHLFETARTSRGQRPRVLPARRLIELDDEAAGDRHLFDPIDDRDRQCYARRCDR